MILVTKCKSYKSSIIKFQNSLLEYQMNKSFYSIIFFLLLLTQSSFALTRGDVQIIEARENIQYLGQRITTDYFLLYTKPYDQTLQSKFRENIFELEYNIQKIADTTKNAVTLNILNFYNYRLEYIKGLMLEKPKLINATKLLEASEYFLEGARSIAEQHQYQSTQEEEILIHCKETRYLIESVSKYYMAFQIGLKDTKYDIKRNQAIRDINKHLNTISQYHYPYHLRVILNQIKNIWRHNQTFFIYLEQTTFPNLVLSSNAQIKELLSNLERYHKQNL